MPYKVINEFTDTENKGHHYKIGDDYPAGGKRPTAKRIKELSEEHPKYKRAFIEKVDEEKEKTSKAKPSSKQ
ncbi:hypothetical protein JF544_16380 [Halobacillus kuroshimensis]|uniref:Uncharacterized protein n=2 Tax=Halobacillus TaxID=45667 RepID=A0A845EGC7_9BACI|nr:MULTISPECIES: hypothetical protein [Halobacillus]MBN8236836.1 hypothetical protein [Halobacillus kuroshimensis]MYL50258.1 hypothetical protein [Halobacillus litoralis]